MSPCEPAAPQVETFEEKVARATRSMSPEKSRVVRLCMEADARDKCCASMLECQRQCQRQVKFLKRSMRDVRARQNLVPKARTKKELAQRKADEEQLAAIRKRYHDYEHEWRVEHTYRVEAYMKMEMQKSRGSSDCCVTLVVSGECVCGTYISGSLFF